MSYTSTKGPLCRYCDVCIAPTVVSLWEDIVILTNSKITSFKDAHNVTPSLNNQSLDGKKSSSKIHILKQCLSRPFQETYNEVKMHCRIASVEVLSPRLLYIIPALEGVILQEDTTQILYTSQNPATCHLTGCV